MQIVAWWLARTEPRSERLAKHHIEKNPNAEAYLPCFWDPFAEKLHPLFPSYIFVRSNDGLWGFLRRTVGVFCVIMRGGEPDIMTDAQMTELREREYQDLVSFQRFVPGQKVDLVKSAFTGWNGIYVGMSSKARCQVLLAMLGQQVTVNVHHKQIRPA